MPQEVQLAASTILTGRRHPFLEQPKKLLIDGSWRAAATGETYPTLNPATGDHLADVPLGGALDIDRAVDAARHAFESGPWSRATPYDRQKLLLRFADLVEDGFDELAWLATLDMGAPITRQMGFKKRAVGLLRYYASMAVSLHGDTMENSIAKDVFSYTLREPIGVVGAITPWNGPIPSTIWKIGPVLATGCTMVLKPAEEAPLVPLRLGELLLEAGIPPGVVNIVTGPGETAGARLVEHPDVDKIAFTGSHVTGQKIIRASAGTVKRLTMELGGKSPNIVFADADIDKAVAGSALAIFNNSGQICSAGSRLFVERKIHDEFVARVAEFGRALKIGDGIDPDTQIGPLVSRQQLERVESFFALGRGEGARLVSGGERLTEGALAKGYFVPPTVFADVTEAMAISREEVFGPLLSVCPFDTIDDVVEKANNTRFGLGAGVWSRDLGTVHQLIRRIRSGVVWVNAYQLADPAVPFGGYKMSGYGRESGRQHIEEYTQLKSVWISPP
jgi:aldehyde dehydrogenase (NAD+)